MQAKMFWWLMLTAIAVVVAVSALVFVKALKGDGDKIEGRIYINRICYKAIYPSASGFRTEITIDQVERSVEISVVDEEPEFLKHLPAGRKFGGIAEFRCALKPGLNKVHVSDLKSITIDPDDYARWKHEIDLEQQEILDIINLRAIQDGSE